MTAYNPAIVALNNMLREQIRLVEQFVEINQRMYESYSTGVNSSYRYTTLEDTQQVSGNTHAERNRATVGVCKTGVRKVWVFLSFCHFGKDATMVERENFGNQKCSNSGIFLGQTRRI